MAYSLGQIIEGLKGASFKESKNINKILKNYKKKKINQERDKN